MELFTDPILASSFTACKDVDDSAPLSLFRFLLADLVFFKTLFAGAKKICITRQ